MGESLKVAVPGHSYVTRLLSHHDGLPYPVVGAHAYIDLEGFYKPGATIQSFQSNVALSNLVEFSPNMTFMLLGGNDIHAACSPRQIVTEMECLTQKIMESTGGIVRWAQIEDRTKVRGMEPDQYVKIKKGIYRICGRSLLMGERMFRLPYNVSELDDGVHPNKDGVRHLSDSLISIISHTAIYYLRNRNDPHFRW